MFSLNPCYCITTRAALSLSKGRCSLDDLGCLKLLEDKLGDAVSWADNEWLGNVKVLNDNLDLSKVIRVNNTCERVQAVLHGQSRAREYMSVCPWRKDDRDSGRHNHTTAWHDNVVVSAEKIITRGSGRRADRKLCLRNKTSDIESHYIS